jgi:hypothetical protein
MARALDEKLIFLTKKLYLRIYHLKKKNVRVYLCIIIYCSTPEQNQKCNE